MSFKSEVKTEAVIGDESEDGDCDEVNQEESEQNEVDRMKEEVHCTGEVMHTWWKQRLVICNEEDPDGRARVVTDKEWVLHVDWTEIKLCR